MTQQDDFDLAGDIEAALIAVALGAASGQTTNNALLRHVSDLRAGGKSLLSSTSAPIVPADHGVRPARPRLRLIYGPPEDARPR